MLFKNDQRFELSKNDIDSLIAEFGITKFPVRFKYVPEMYTQTKDNEKPDRPRSVSIPWLETVTEDIGINAYRFAESVYPGSQNQAPVYYPHREMVHEVMIIPRHEIEKLWFLLKYSKHVRGGKNASQSLNTYLVMEDRKAEAKAKIDAEREIINLKSLLYDEATLRDDEIRDLGKALYMDNTDEMSREEIVEAVVSAINLAQNKADYCKNVRLLLANDTVKSADNVLIQNAVDYEVVIFVKSKGAVFFKDDAGNPDQMITKVKSGVDWKKSFGDYLARNQKAKELLQIEVDKKQKLATQSE